MVMLLSQADTLKDTLTRKDLQRLQGTWEFVSGTREARLSITGNHFVITFKTGEAYLGAFELDPTHKPKAIDLTIDEGPERHKGKAAHGIYLLDGEHLVLCPGLPGSLQRLEAFPDSGERQHLCIVFRKHKNAEG